MSTRPVRSLTVLLTLMCIALALVMGANSSLGIAQPGIAVDLGADQSELAWIVNAYALVFAALLLPVGIAADRFGRREFLVGGLLLFGLATLASALVASSTSVIVLRGVAGAGAAAVMPATLSVLVDAFPRERRSAAVAVWAGVSGAGAVVGLLLAGAMLEVAWWGSIQLVFGGAALVVALAAALVVPRSRQPDLALDPLGGLLALVGLAALVYGIIQGGEDGWTARGTLLAVGAGLATLLVFVLHELRSSAPMLDVRLFRRRALVAGSLVVALQFFAAFGLFFLLPQFLQLVLGYGPFEAALRVLPISLGIAPAARFGPSLMRRLGTRASGTWGMLQMATAFVLLAWIGDGDYWRIAVALAVLGFGFGLALTPATVLIISGLPADRRTLSAAVNDVTREVGGALGGALAASVLVGVYGSTLRTSVGSSPTLAGLPAEVREAAQGGLAQALGVAGRLGPAGAELSAAAQDAFLLGLRTHLVLGAGALAVGGLLCALLAPRTVTVDDPVEDAGPIGDAPDAPAGHQVAFPTSDRAT